MRPIKRSATNEMLAFLALHPAGATRDELLDALARKPRSPYGEENHLPAPTTPGPKASSTGSTPPYSTSLDPSAPPGSKPATPRGALQAAERAISLDDLHEPSWRLALQADHALGLYSDITKHYDALAHILDEQLGLEPSHETRMMYRQLLGQAQEPTPQTTGTVALLRSLARSPGAGSAMHQAFGRASMRSHATSRPRVPATCPHGARSGLLPTAP